MDKTYLFSTDKGRFIVNDERSGIGYSYPRIFIECSNGKYFNVDCTLGQTFHQRKSDFESWIDGTEVRNADLGEVCRDLGLSKDAVESVVIQIQDFTTR